MKNQEMEKLFFELASESRLNILGELNKNHLKMTEISKNLDITSTETFRQLQRLSKSSFISKDVDGYYKLTPMGEHILRLLPSFEFFTKHKKYFVNHLSANIPEEFVYRIGELNNCKYTKNIMVSYQEVKTLYEEAKQYILGLSNQITPYSPPFIERAMKRGVNVRLLLLEDMVFPPGFEPIPLIPDRIEIRTLDQLDIGMVISEKKATIVFLTLEGKFDQSNAFVAKDERSKKWCKDLFEYYWIKGKKGLPKSYPQN